MRLGLEGKTALITGSSRGIGLAIAKAFLDEGAEVVINGRDDNTLNVVVGGLSELYPGRVYCVAADITTGEGRAEVFRFIEDRGRLDVFIANLGSGKPEVADALEPYEIQRLYDINVMGNEALLHDIYPYLKLGNNPSIVFISSIVAKEALTAPVGYAMAKAAVLTLSKYLSLSGASDGIRVNCVLPGNIYFEGGRWEELMEADPDGVQAYIDSNVPLKRFGIPEEIADAVIFLSSERAGFITGVSLVVDGGQTRIV